MVTVARERTAPHITGGKPPRGQRARNAAGSRCDRSLALPDRERTCGRRSQAAEHRAHLRQPRPGTVSRPRSRSGSRRVPDLGRRGPRLAGPVPDRLLARQAMRGRARSRRRFARTSTTRARAHRSGAAPQPPDRTDLADLRGAAGHRARVDRAAARQAGPEADRRRPQGGDHDLVLGADVAPGGGPGLRLDPVAPPAAGVQPAAGGADRRAFRAGPGIAGLLVAAGSVDAGAWPPTTHPGDRRAHAVVRINKLAPPHVELYVKLEAFNPMGSVKDRLALGVIEDAERTRRAAARARP